WPAPWRLARQRGFMHASLTAIPAPREQYQSQSRLCFRSYLSSFSIASARRLEETEMITGETNRGYSSSLDLARAYWLSSGELFSTFGRIANRSGVLDYAARDTFRFRS